MKRPAMKVDMKKMARITTISVAVVCLALLSLTAWFIMSTLNEVAAVQQNETTDVLKIEGIDSQLLQKVKAARAQKTSDERRLGPDLPNPFARQPEPAPPQPEPTPAPAT